MPKKADTAMKVFVMGMIGLTGYGAFALTNSLYKLKKLSSFQIFITSKSTEKWHIITLK